MRKPLLILLTLSLFACKKEVLQEVNFGYDYAKLQVGKYVIYDVDSIVYDDFFPPVKIDTFQFQIKEIIDSKFIDGTGSEAYKIIRYKRLNDTAEWVLTDVWSSKLTTTTYEVVEENLRFIKLVFPIKTNKTWDGNSKNNLDLWEYEYTSTNQNESVGNINFDSVTTVLQFDDKNEVIIQRNFAEEKYAAGIGLVYKKFIDVEKDFDSQTNLWIRTKGVDYTMTINSYSN